VKERASEVSSFDERFRNRVSAADDRREEEEEGGGGRARRWEEERMKLPK